MIEKHDWIPI